MEPQPHEDAEAASQSHISCDKAGGGFRDACECGDVCLAGPGAPKGRRAVSRPTHQASQDPHAGGHRARQADGPRHAGCHRPHVPARGPRRRESATTIPASVVQAPDGQSAECRGSQQCCGSQHSSVRADHPVDASGICWAHSDIHDAALCNEALEVRANRARRDAERLRQRCSGPSGVVFE